MQPQQVQPSQRQIAESKFKAARSNLLLMIAFTMVNILLLFIGSNMVMLFSATVPYVLAGIGHLSGYDAVRWVCIGIAAACMVSYLLCWIFSKKHYGWMIAALVLFIIDTLVLVGSMLLLQEVSGVMDVLFHGWVVYYLILGVKYGHQLKTLPEEPTAVDNGQMPRTEPLDTVNED